MKKFRVTWDNLKASSDVGPGSRSKHAIVRHCRSIYLYGGRRRNSLLKDFWKYDFDSNSWEEIKVSGSKPGHLQEHTMVEYNDKLYVFGGEVNFCNDQEISLWVFNIKENIWEKERTVRGSQGPSSLRGHTATIYNDSMYIFGGYQDLKGSTSDVWMFHFPSKSWHLVFRAKPSAGPIFIPTPRHNHSTVLHDSSIWVYGGLDNLQPTSEFIRFDLEWQTWHKIKKGSGPAPEALHSHLAAKLKNNMILIGGTKDGQLSRNIWIFHFATSLWEMVDPGLSPILVRHNMAGVTLIDAVVPENDDESFLRNDQISSNRMWKGSMFKNTASKFRQATSLSSLNKMSVYGSLVNLSQESLIKENEPYCMFAATEKSSKLHFQQKSAESENIELEHEEKHQMFAEALNNSSNRITKTDSGIELGGTYFEKRFNEEDDSILIIGGTQENELPWQKESIFLGQMRIGK